MNCPKCGAPIIFNDENDYVFCSYCGTQVFKTGNTKHTYVHRTINEARIMEAENYARELDMEERRELREEKTKRIKLIIRLILAVILTVTVIYIYLNNVFLFWIMVLFGISFGIIFIMYYLFKPKD